MKWEFTSWGNYKLHNFLLFLTRNIKLIIYLLLVPLASRICPSDTYKVYKQGSNVRIDTTLLGFDHTKWQRGNRSYIFKGQSEYLNVVLCMNTLTFLEFILIVRFFLYVFFYINSRVFYLFYNCIY